MAATGMVMAGMGWVEGAVKRVGGVAASVAAGGFGLNGGVADAVFVQTLA